MKFERFADQGEEHRHFLAPAANSGKRDHVGALQGPFDIVGQEVQQSRDITAADSLVGFLQYFYIRSYAKFVRLCGNRFLLLLLLRGVAPSRPAANYATN